MKPAGQAPSLGAPSTLPHLDGAGRSGKQGEQQECGRPPAPWRWRYVHGAHPAAIENGWPMRRVRARSARTAALLRAPSPLRAPTASCLAREALDSSWSAEQQLRAASILWRGAFTCIASGAAAQAPLDLCLCLLPARQLFTPMAPG